MFTKIYKGLCIGGPLDGRYFDHNAEYYRGVVLPPCNRSINHEAIPETSKLDTYTYKYIPVNTGRGELGVWILEDSHLHDAIIRLFACYACFVASNNNETKRHIGKLRDLRG